MSTKVAARKRKRRTTSSSDRRITSQSEKAKVIKGSIRAAYALTKELEDVRKVKPESLLQPMTL
jgi:hypothetical protein